VIQAIHGVKGVPSKAPLTTASVSNCLTADKLVVGKIQALSLQEKQTEAYAELRTIVQNMMSDVVRQHLDPLASKIQEMAEQNNRLADRIDQMEKRNAVLRAKARASIEAAKSSFKSALATDIPRDAADSAWGERGGLVTGLSPQDDNPFCGRLRRP
jgi:uncharacterized phage infection (PIP) family protein YhgE